MNKGIFLLVPLAFIATCGLALAGIKITAVTDTQPREGTKRTYWIAFCVAWVVSTLVFIAHTTFFDHTPLTPVLIRFAFVVVVPVAFVISMTYSRIPAVKNYLSSWIRLRGVRSWSILALVLTPALVLLSIPISSLLGRNCTPTIPRCTARRYWRVENQKYYHPEREGDKQWNPC